MEIDEHHGEVNSRDPSHNLHLRFLSVDLVG
jgi:hypothetical protein